MTSFQYVQVPTPHLTDRRFRASSRKHFRTSPPGPLTVVWLRAWLTHVTSFSHQVWCPCRQSLNSRRGRAALTGGQCWTPTSTGSSRRSIWDN